MRQSALALVLVLTISSGAHADGTMRSLLALAPEDSRVLGFCDVAGLREAEFLTPAAFDLVCRRLYAEHLLGQTDGEPPVLPCRRVLAAVIAAPGAAPSGMLFLRCEGLNRDQFRRDLLRNKEITRLDSLEAPGVRMYHRKVPPAPPAEGLAGLLRATFPMPREIWFAVLDDSTLVLSTRGVRDLVQVAASRKQPRPGARTEQLQLALAHLDPENDLAGLAVAGEVIPHQVSWVIPAQFKGLFQPLDHLALQARGSDPTRIRVTLCTKKHNQADEFRECFDQQLTRWKDRGEIWKWLLAGYGVGRLSGVLSKLPEPVQDYGELTQIGLDVVRRVEVRQDRTQVEVRCKIEAREIENLLKIIRPHLPAAR